MIRKESPFEQPHLNVPSRFRLPLSAYATGILAAFSGLICLILSLFIGPAVFDSLWGVEPLAYIGGVLLLVGLLIGAIGLAAAALESNRRYMMLYRNESTEEEQNRHWIETTRQFFEVFDHDLGRPLRRIAGKERELRAALQAAGEPENPAVRELLDEIERQTPNFRLMLSNIQVLVQLQAPGAAPAAAPVEPSEVVRRIADRYTPVAAEADKEITWWAEPADFGMVASDSHAIEHIVTNLVDNAVSHASNSIQVSLSKDNAQFYVTVWDDGPGIAPHYLDHLFDRGWTPEVGRREEKTSSGLGLFIARTLARRCNGEVTVESTAAPQPDHHTTFQLALPLKAQ